MYPLDFKEFLIANGLNHFKDYLIVGGLPECVKTFVKTENIKTIRTIQTNTSNFKPNIPSIRKC